MRIDLSEGIDPAEWGDVRSDDRVQVGGVTVWTGPFTTPVIVTQPNRWGVIEPRFPDVPCVVEVDPAVSGWLLMPADVVGYVDRAHRPVDAPQREASGKKLMERARRLAKIITQTRGVVVAATPFARTIPLLTPLDSQQLITGCKERGVVGMRPLSGMAGAVALTVREEHDEEHFRRVAEVLASVLEAAG